jgi:uncharacterized protein YciI
MQFILIAYDGSDEGALDRRLAVRAAHLESARKLVADGKWLYAAGILDDDGKMIGSMILCDFPSREALQDEWLKNEPYVTGNVWEKITIQRANVPPFLLP